MTVHILIFNQVLTSNWRWWLTLGTCQLADIIVGKLINITAHQEILWSMFFCKYLNWTDDYSVIDSKNHKCQTKWQEYLWENYNVLLIALDKKCKAKNYNF